MKTLYDDILILESTFASALHPHWKTNPTASKRWQESRLAELWWAKEYTSLEHAWAEHHGPLDLIYLNYACLDRETDLKKWRAVTDDIAKYCVQNLEKTNDPRYKKMLHLFTLANDPGTSKENMADIDSQAGYEYYACNYNGHSSALRILISSNNESIGNLPHWEFVNRGYYTTDVTRIVCHCLHLDVEAKLIDIAGIIRKHIKCPQNMRTSYCE